MARTEHIRTGPSRYDHHIHHIEIITRFLNGDTTPHTINRDSLRKDLVAMKIINDLPFGSFPINNTIPRKTAEHNQKLVRLWNLSRNHDPPKAAKPKTQSTHTYLRKKDQRFQRASDKHKERKKDLMNACIFTK